MSGPRRYICAHINGELMFIVRQARVKFDELKKLQKSCYATSFIVLLRNAGEKFSKVAFEETFSEVRELQGAVAFPDDRVLK
jgi:hypothetical protein